MSFLFVNLSEFSKNNLYLIRLIQNSVSVSEKKQLVFNYQWDEGDFTLDGM